MGDSRLAEWLGRYVRLTEGELGALVRLEEQRRTVRRGTALVQENDASRELFVLRSGWLHSSVALGNGGRQIMRLYFPSDLICMALLAFAESPETVTAVTDATVSVFARERLGELFVDHPRLAAMIGCVSVAERVAMADRLASIGRTPALARVAALLCEIFTRLEASGEPRDEVHIPLTQEEMGDATGLTAVHVNRMMRRLAEEGIIERNGPVVRLKDKDRLCRQANYTARDALETAWLPPPR